MLGLSRKDRFRTAQILLALMSSLWLFAAVAPCVMAAPSCPPGMAGDCPSMDQPGLTVAGDCNVFAAVDCQSSGEQRLAASTPIMDFSVVPVRLPGLSLVAALRTTHAPDRYATVILTPPLNLQHAVLLI
jgi:hypothetical protein